MCINIRDYARAKLRVTKSETHSTQSAMAVWWWSGRVVSISGTAIAGKLSVDVGFPRQSMVERLNISIQAELIYLIKYLPRAP